MEAAHALDRAGLRSIKLDAWRHHGADHGRACDSAFLGVAPRALPRQLRTGFRHPATYLPRLADPVVSRLDPLRTPTYRVANESFVLLHSWRFICSCYSVWPCSAMGNCARQAGSHPADRVFTSGFRSGACSGGAFNSLVAPLVFRSAIEFPLVLIFAALLRSQSDSKLATTTQSAWPPRKDLGCSPWPLVSGMIVVILAFAAAAIAPGIASHRSPLLLLGAALLAAFEHAPCACRGSGCNARCWFVPYAGPYGKIIDSERNFFGVVRVTSEPSGKYRYFIHNGTLHGMQSIDPARKPRAPSLITSKSGPAGQIMRALQPEASHGDLAIVGLGAAAIGLLLAARSVADLLRDRSISRADRGRPALLHFS